MLLPNHLDLDQALHELRDEQPSGEQRARGLDALQRPPRRSLRLPSLAAAAVIIIVGLTFIPIRGSSFTWSEILLRTQQASNLHITNLDDKGQVIGEQWRSGPMWADWRKDKEGRILFEARSDDKQFYTYLRRPNLTAPNATQYATLWNKTPRSWEADKKFANPRMSVDEWVKSGSAKVVSQGKAEVDGAEVQRYVVTMYKEEKTIDADPKTGRILTVRLKGGEVVKVDYPDSIDPKVFAYRSRITQDVAVLDLRGREEPKKLPPYMPEVMASKGGIQLRGVSVSAEGDLFVNWTGYLPSKRDSVRMKLIGIKTGKVLGFGSFYDGIHPVKGPAEKRLIYYRVELPEKIGDRVTVRIPTATSYVEFKDVKVGKPTPLRN